MTTDSTRKRTELERLIKAFEIEAAKFHEVRLSRFAVIAGQHPGNRVFQRPNHTVRLWQYYGAVGSRDIDAFMENIKHSDLTWGIRGAEVSAFACIEGAQCKLFVQMAKRAAALFDAKEAETISQRIVREICDKRQKDIQGDKKVIAIANSNLLAVWLNHLLFDLSLTYPGREKEMFIEPDPFSLSLRALERMRSTTAPDIVATSETEPFARRRFRVGLSFAGERRAFVEKIAHGLKTYLGPHSVFFDQDYQAELARPNVDLLLQTIYRERCDLVVVFCCADYASKEWCGLEWRVVREIIKQKQDEQVMFIRFDNAPIDGLLSIDGFIDASSMQPEDLTALILKRVAQSNPSPASNNLSS